MILEVIAIAGMLKMHPEVKPMVYEPKQIIVETSAGIDCYDISDYERHLLERCVMSEAGGESAEAQEAVATVILNRVFCPDKFYNNIHDVITAANQFSTHYNGEPTVSVRTAVHNALAYYGTSKQIIPAQVYYFRDTYYHEWALDYCHYGNMYFSAPKEACLD